MTVLGKQTSWAESKKELSKPDFLKNIKTYDKDKVKDVTLKKIEK